MATQQPVHRLRAVSWLLVYLLVAIGPLLLSLIDLDPGRGFWVNLSVALGFVGLSLMGLQFVLAARFVRASEHVGIDLILQVHRQMTWVIAVCIFAHPIILFVWDTRFLGLLNVITAPLRAKFAVASVVFLLALIVTSVWRRRLRLSYQTWQVLHSVLATLVVVTGLVHALLIGYYINEPWEKALWIAYSAAFLWIGAWVRIIKPVLRWRRQWAVVGVREQPGGHTITLEPRRADHHFHFKAGQFAWINVGRSPFSIEYHPFSISSSAASTDRIEFTIKTEKGFTAKVHDFQPGQAVYLDGPYGHFTLDRVDGPGLVFIGGGVGITPLLSMLSTMADQGDRTPCWAFIGNRREDQMIGRAELEALESRLNLTIVQTLSGADDSWTGRRGRVDAALLAAVLPADRQGFQYFLCGSNPMMDGAEAALTALGAPPSTVHSERFVMA